MNYLELKPLDPDNYFEWCGRLSNSFVKSFLQCPAAAKASSIDKEKGSFNEAFFIGHAVEGLLCEGEDGFNKVLNRLDYKDHVLTNAGKPRAFVEKSKSYAQAALNQPFFMKHIDDVDSKFQVVLEFEIAGYKMKCALDLLNLTRKFLLDIKTVGQEFFKRWNNDKTENFIKAWGYLNQLGIYREAVRQNYEGMDDISCLIGAVTKTKIPDVDIFWIPNYRLDAAMIEVEASVETVGQALQEGRFDRCGTCDHCISTKKLSGYTNYDDFAKAWN